MMDSDDGAEQFANRATPAEHRAAHEAAQAMEAARKHVDALEAAQKRGSRFVAAMHATKANKTLRVADRRARKLGLR